jgi:hypothetical protein
MTWASIVSAVLGLFRSLLLPFAFMFGKLAGRKEQQAEQDKVNAEAQTEYAKIAVEPRTDDDLDKRLSDGSL